VILLESLERRYRGKGGVTDVRLTVPAGAIYVLCGANGSGKTTTLSVLAGLLFSRHGSLELNGRAVPLDRFAPRPGLSYIPDTPVLDDALTGWQWLTFVAAIRRERRPENVDEYVRLLQLDPGRLASRIRTLSFGNRRKVALLAALATSRTALLLDEPLIGLDPAAIQGFHDAARHFVSSGRSILLSTHLLREAESLATHAGILHDGRTVAEGTLDDVRASGSLHDAFFRAAL
jgi:ABC-2 type transport system ATP-binding protein